MKIIADLHVHSRYSRATAKSLDLENLYVAAQIKGVQVIGTGDFSHPAWFAEIESKLEPSEPGLFRLKKEISKTLDPKVPARCRGIVRFVLAAEISNIYKKEGRTRKNHNLVLAPDIETVRLLNRKLDKIGNIKSDGRPILGLDARDLLEVVIETCPDACLIPAHIWTPWFSMLGSKSGFDSLSDCFGDLTSHIFAVETGLSSDPAMNWRVSFLDGITLVSNSDAHSPANLGREANRFDTELTYHAMRDALKSGDPQRFSGTIEFYPEEGKYHMDGHRSCGVCLTPAETSAHQGLCPQCGKPLTVGVLNRVEELADRPSGMRPEKAHPYQNLVPLTDILAEILQVGPKTQKVSQAYRAAIEALGPELRILQESELKDIERAGIPLLAQAVQRVRENRIDIRPGFDGEYGQVRLFTAQEREQIQGQKPLFLLPEDALPAPGTSEITIPHGRSIPRRPEHPGICSSSIEQRPRREEINEEQRRILEYEGNRLVIVAGPGTGKTHTLTRRIAYRISARGVPAEQVLAVTFTNKAAGEMRERLKALLGDNPPQPLVTTFHGWCLQMLLEDRPEPAFGIIDEDEQLYLLREAAAMAARSGMEVPLNGPALQSRIMRAKQNLLLPEELDESANSVPEASWVGAVYRAYRQLMESQRLLDYEDLIFKVARRLEEVPEFARSCRSRFQHVYVDEYQDLNHGQYRIIRSLVPTESKDNSLCVIGDPDQSIYGFRGSDSGYFKKFLEDYPAAALFQLTQNYRSTRAVLSASFQVINRDGIERSRTYSTIDGAKTLTVLELADEHAEAESIGRVIDGLVGGSGFHSIDTGRVKPAYPSQARGYADFAILTRTSEQLRIIGDGLERCGIPFQTASRRRVFKEKGVIEVLALLKVLSGGGSYADFEKVAALLAPTLGRRVVSAFKEWGFKNRLCLKEALSGVTRFPIPSLKRDQQFALTGLAERLSAMNRETASKSGDQRLLNIINHPGIAPAVTSEKTREALNRLAATAADSDADHRWFFNRLFLCTDTDLYHPRAEKTALMTMHAAKGLEFPVVFISGCEDGLIPYRRSPGSAEADSGEERRLFYVAMTRAKERLYLTRARRRKVFGKTVDRDISPFVTYIEQALLKDESPHGKRRRRRPDQLQLF
jgi:uncharacterized protein (TIGR00375 family)